MNLKHPAKSNRRLGHGRRLRRKCNRRKSCCFPLQQAEAAQAANSGDYRKASAQDT